MPPLLAVVLGCAPSPWIEPPSPASQAGQVAPPAPDAGAAVAVAPPRRAAPETPAADEAAPEPEAEARPDVAALCRGRTCRPPTTVSLTVGADRAFRVTFPALPYVYRDSVRAMPQDDFFITGDVKGDRLENLRHVPKPAARKNVIGIRFVQRVATTDPAIAAVPAKPSDMVLRITNHYARPLTYRARIQSPGHARFRETTVLRVQPGLSVFEHWQEPLVTILLSDFRFARAGEPEAHECCTPAPAPRRLYAAILCFTIDRSGELLTFRVDHVIDPASGTTKPVAVVPPDSFVQAARRFVVGKKYKPAFEDGKPEQICTWVLHDPARPGEVVLRPKRR
jgi:hypothetical protein